MALPPMASNNQLMRSMRSGGLATMVGWGGGQPWLKRCGGWSNGQATTAGGRGATTTLTITTKTTINKCAAAEAEDVCGGRGKGQRRLVRGGAQWWRQRSNCCAAAEEKQLWDKAMEDEGRRQVGRGMGVHFFPTFNPTSQIVSKIRGNFWDFGGVFLLWFEVGLGLVGLKVILQSFLVILHPIIPWILPQSYLKSCWDYGPEIGNHSIEGSNATQTQYLHRGQKDKNIKNRTRFVGPLVMDPTMPYGTTYIVVNRRHEIWTRVSYHK